MDWCSSDHRPLVTSLNLGVDVQELTDNSCVRFNLVKADWELFHLYLKEKTDKLMEIKYLRADRLAERLQDAVVKSASCSIPVKKKLMVRSNKWWNAELSELRKQVRLSRRRYQAYRYRSDIDSDLIEEYRNEFRRVRNRYHERIKKLKRDTWRGFVGDEGNRSPWGLVYRFVTEKLTIQEAMSSIKVGSVSSKNYMESLKFLLCGLLPLDNLDDYNEEQKELVLLNDQYINSDRVDQFTKEELEQVLKQLKSNKAPGWEGISNEILKEAVSVVPDLFLKSFNLCLEEGVFPVAWKKGLIKFLLKSADKDKSNVRSYRPICLLPVIGKLLERLIVVKLKKWVGGAGLYHPR